MPRADPAAFQNAAKLAAHFESHGSEMGYTNPASYLKGAQNLVKGGQDVQTYLRADGSTIFFRSSTGEYGVLSADNVIKTYFIPSVEKGGLTPEEYWGGRFNY